MSFLKDLTTLDVITVTGQINSSSSGSGSSSAETIVDFENLFGKDSNKKTKIRADLRVVAATHVEIDKDTMTFIADDLSDSERELVAMHNDIVTSASRARAEIVARFLPNPNKQSVGEGNS